MSAYANHYAEGAGRRPRRRVYFTTTSIIAALGLGAVIGAALTAIFIHSQRVAYQSAVCVLRGPDEGLLPVASTGLQGLCEIRR